MIHAVLIINGGPVPRRQVPGGTYGLDLARPESGQRMGLRRTIADTLTGPRESRTHRALVLAQALLPHGGRYARRLIAGAGGFEVAAAARREPGFREVHRLCKPSPVASALGVAAKAGAPPGSERTHLEDVVRVRADQRDGASVDRVHADLHTKPEHEPGLLGTLPLEGLWRQVRLGSTRCVRTAEPFCDTPLQLGRAGLCQPQVS